MKGVIILGSGRSDGNTSKVVYKLHEILGYDIIDLNGFHFSQFDYNHNNRNDAFIPLMKDVVGKYDTIIFATPIYWYAMSGIMKKFFDRLSDLLKIEKEIGRKMRGKSMGVLSCSGHDDQGDFFWKPFMLSADYLGMSYIGNTHIAIGENGVSDKMMERLKRFSVMIKGED